MEKTTQAPFVDHSALPAGVDRPHNAEHPHHHVVNEGINALPGNDGVDQLEMEKETQVHGHYHSDGSIRKHDVEIGETPAYSAGERSSNLAEEEAASRSKFSIFYHRYRIFFHLAIAAFFTAWWIVGLVLHRDIGWLKPFLLWLAIILRLITFHVPIAKWIYKAMGFTWHNTVSKGVQMMPAKLRMPAATVGTVAVFLVGTFVTAETNDNSRSNRAISLFGLLVIIFVLWATSTARKAVKWQTVLVGMLTQFIVALFVLRTQAGYDIFAFIGEMAGDLLGFAAQGTEFLTNNDIANNHTFFMSVIPAIIFFVALTQLLYYWNILQWFIGKFAVFFSWSMQASGAESVVAAASPFIGQGESAMLVRPFVAHMTMAEIHQIMTSGFATIAGSVLAAYISFGVNPQAVISSCVMSIPASIAISKLRYPETEETLTTSNFKIPEDKEDRPANALHAFANGAWLGVKIAGMIVATLLCIIALLGLVNGLLMWGGQYFGIQNPTLTVQLMLGYICYPIAFLLGVPRADLLKVGELIGTKIVVNEFVAFEALTSKARYLEMSPRSILIASYALCGFGNLGSLGTQIGVLSQVAPGRAGDVSKLAVSALICGILSTLTSAAVAGLLVTDQFVVKVPRPS